MLEEVVAGVALGADGKDKGIVDDAELVKEDVELSDAEEVDSMDERELAELSSIEDVKIAE